MGAIKKEAQLSLIKGRYDWKTDSYRCAPFKRRCLAALAGFEYRNQIKPYRVISVLKMCNKIECER